MHAIRAALRDDGTWLLVDIKALDTFEQNIAKNPMAPLMYGISVFSCMSSALSGAGWRRARHARPAAGEGRGDGPRGRVHAVPQAAGRARRQRVLRSAAVGAGAVATAGTRCYPRVSCGRTTLPAGASRRAGRPGAEQPQRPAEAREPWGGSSDVAAGSVLPAASGAAGDDVSIRVAASPDRMVGAMRLYLTVPLDRRQARPGDRRRQRHGPGHGPPVRRRGRPGRRRRPRPGPRRCRRRRRSATPTATTPPSVSSPTWPTSGRCTPGRDRRRRVRRPRHPRQQRRRGAGDEHPAGRGRLPHQLGQDGRRQPHRPRPPRAPRRAPLPRGRRRAGRQHRVDRVDRHDGRDGRLHGHQGRRRRADEEVRRRARPPGHHRQLHLPRPDPHGHDGRRSATPTRRPTPSAACRCAATATPRRSPR